jgi:hypothetical protein
MIVCLKRKLTTIKKLQVQFHPAKATCYILTHGNSLMWRALKEKESFKCSIPCFVEVSCKQDTRNQTKIVVLIFLMLAWMKWSTST